MISASIIVFFISVIFFSISFANGILKQYDVAIWCAFMCSITLSVATLLQEMIEEEDNSND